VTKYDAELQKLAADMRDTMTAYEGVGLAGNQVGELKRILVVDVPMDDETRVKATLVNPTVSRRSGSETAEEGCLSMPGIFADVARSAKLHVTAVNEFGEPFELDAEGYLARAIQHEIDHLDGILFVDRLSLLKRQFLRRNLDALARGELPEGYRQPASRESAG
jgi:peptide deformylase